MKMLPHAGGSSAEEGGADGAAAGPCRTGCLPPAVGCAAGRAQRTILVPTGAMVLLRKLIARKLYLAETGVSWRRAAVPLTRQAQSPVLVPAGATVCLFHLIMHT